MTRGVTVPFLVGVVFVVGVFLIAVFMVVRHIDAQSDRCNPQGGCVDAISSPHVMRRS